MANRVPLILNTSSNQIQELPTGDNLDLSNSGIHNAGVITATSFTGDGSNLTGLTAVGVGAIGGLTVKNDGSVVGTAGSISSFDFIGSYITATANTGAAGVTTVTLSETPTFSAVTVTNNINANGRIVGAATSNVIPFLYSNYSDLPSAATYHGAFAHVHATQKAYYAHGGNWSELVNREQTGVVGTGTDQYNIGITSVTALTATTVSASSTITATNFVGDGSGLTGVTASGTGIIIKNNGSAVGTAGTIDFGTALSVSAISGAAVTVTASTPNNLTPATLVVAGVTTATGNVSIGSSLLLGQSKKALFTGGSGKLEIYRDASNTFIADSGAGDFYIQGGYTRLRNAAGTKKFADFAENLVNLYHNDATKLALSSTGVVITGITTTTTLEVNNRYGLSTGFGTFVASAGVAHTVDTFTIATNNFKTAEYTLHLEETTNSQTEKVLVMQNGTTAFSNEYAVMYNGNLLVSIGATVVSGSVKLEVTPRAGISGLTTYRFTRETMK